MPIGMAIARLKRQELQRLHEVAERDAHD